MCSSTFFCRTILSFLHNKIRVAETGLTQLLLLVCINYIRNLFLRQSKNPLSSQEFSFSLLTLRPKLSCKSTISYCPLHIFYINKDYRFFLTISFFRNNFQHHFMICFPHFSPVIHSDVFVFIIPEMLS